MLSFLIPTYNHVCTSLARELSRQITASGIDGEVVVMDDGSTDKKSVEENRLIESMEHCRFVCNEKNVGRSCIRNLLTSTARYDTLVFLDSDVFPKNDDFVVNYANVIGKTDVACGGMVYRMDGPYRISKLRLTVGIKAESMTAEERNREPYGKFISSNFLISKAVFRSVKFDETIYKYGYEDVLFGKCLQNKSISICHIENVVFHDNEDTSDGYLEKTRESINTLIHIEEKIGAHSSLLNVYKKLDRLCISKGIALFYRLLNKLMEKHLLSDHPTYFLFSIYKLSYLCYLKNK